MGFFDKVFSHILFSTVTRVNQKFYNILVCANLQCVTEVVQAVGGTVIGSIVVVGVLTCYALLHSVCDLKVPQKCAT